MAPPILHTCRLLSCPVKCARALPTGQAMAAITWRRSVAVGGGLVALYLLGPGPLASAAVWLVVLAGTCTAIAVGIRRHQPRGAWCWWTLCGGFGLLLVASLLRFPLWAPRGLYPVVVTASLLAYATMCAAALGLVRAQAPGRDREGAIDGAIVMVALATVLSGTVLAPEAFGGVSTPLEPVLLVVPPLIVAAIIAVTLRLLFGGSTRLPSAWLLVGAAVAGLAGNVVRMMLAAAGSYQRGDWPDVLLLAAAASVATAALHPSMARITAPAAAAPRRPVGGRLAVLAVALVAAPASLLVSEPGALWALPVLASLALSLLVFWRLAALVLEREAVRRALDEHAARQEAVARIGRHALRDGDLEALFAEATAVTAELLGLERCTVTRSPAGTGPGRVAWPPAGTGPGGVAWPPAGAGPGTVALPLGDTPQAAVLVAAGPGAYSDEDAAFLQAVANVLTGALERRRTQEVMRRRALHDPLTELPNRTELRDRLAAALSRAATDRSTVALLFIDLDGFKGVNDQLGHQAGDELLVAVARRLARTVRPADTLARLAGDEFVIVCERSSRTEAGALAERAAAVLAEPFALSTGQARLGASIGIALGEGRDGVDRLLSEADTAMYRAKERSGCSVAFFDGELRQQASRRRRIEAGLCEALARRQFHLLYQPLAVLGGAGEPAGVEAVPCWEHPSEGHLAAEEFLPLAEGNGTIVALGEWVMREACGQFARWRAQPPGASPLTLLVGVTARQLAEPTLPAHVERVLRETGVNPAEVCLEIAGQAPLDERRASVLADLRATGVRLALGGFDRSLAGLAGMGAGPDVVTVGLPHGARPPRRSDQALIAAATGAASVLGVEVLAPVGAPGTLEAVAAARRTAAGHPAATPRHPAAAGGLARQRPELGQAGPRR